MKRKLFLLACIFALAAIFLFNPVKAQAAGENYLTIKVNSDGVSCSVTDCSLFAEGAVDIPATYNGMPVTGIADYAFYGNYYITSITIPNSVVTIGNSAFRGCSSLEEVTIPNSVVTIDNYAFYDCDYLTDITIPNGVTSIGDYAFASCMRLQNVTMANSVKTLGDGAFYSCVWLKDVTLSNKLTSIGDSVFYCCDDLTNITIPSGVTGIDDYAFAGCSALANITLPETLSSIGVGAFNSCNALVAPVLPDSITSIGAGAFKNCIRLNSIAIPKGVTSISKELFSGCSALSDVTIPSGVTSIGQNAFACLTLKHVIYGGTKNDWSGISIESGNSYATSATIHYGAAIKETFTKATVSANGSMDRKCTVCGTAISSKEISKPESFLLQTDAYTYDGTEKTPEVYVRTASGVLLEQGVDYTVTYASGRKNAGTYKVTITMQGNYTGTKELTFKINPVDVSDGTASLNKTSYTYNGKVQQPTVTVKDTAGKTLKKDTDYTVTYASGCKKAGTYKVTIKFKGNYTGSKTLTYKINPASTSKFKFSLAKTSYTYNGKAQKPSVTVKDTAGKTLKKDTDYTVTYASGCKNVGTYKVTIKFKGNYTGSKTLTFKINPASVSKFKATLSKSSYTYNGKVQKPSVTVKDTAGKTLKKDTDYTVTYASGCKKAGTYKVTIKFKGNYTGTKTLTFKINPASASKFKVSLAKTVYAYNGKAQKPSVTVKDAAGKTLKKGTDYTVSYASGCKNVGTYKVTIKFKGNYTGTKTATYTIKPTTKDSVSVLANGTAKIGAKSNTKITYTSSNTKVAKVNAKGVITGVKAGTATITVKSNGVTQKIKVKVTTPSVKITGTNSMALKTSVTLKATTNTGAKVKWSSSDTKVATVTSKGKVTGVKVGTATIYAKVTFNGKTYTAKYKVTVKKPYLEKTSGTVRMGQTYSIDVVGGSGTTTYSSSNTAVATVTSKGVVKGIKAGTATITVKRSGYTMSFKVTVKDFSDVVLYEDSKIKITFKSVEKSEYYDDELELYFTVKNKTGKTLLIQADAVSLNGYSFCDLTMSDEVFAYSTGTINLTVDTFDFNLVDINKITSIGGQFRIINDDNWSDCYEAIFNNVRFDGKGTTSRPSTSGLKKLYSDSNCAIYYKSAEKSKYYDDELEVYLYVENKTDMTLLIQADVLTINGYSYDDLTISDCVLSNTLGIVNISVDDVDFSTLSVKNIKTMGGKINIINDSNWSDNYDAIFGEAKVK